MPGPRPKWLLRLLKVHTTPEQARQILGRNRPLLSGLDTVTAETRIRGAVGCPHCGTIGSVHLGCATCAWQEYNRGHQPCVYADFDGVNLIELMFQWPLCLQYSSIDELISFALPFNPATTQEIQDCKQTIRTFLEAHILWAETVLEEAQKKGEHNAELRP